VHRRIEQHRLTVPAEHAERLLTGDDAHDALSRLARRAHKLLARCGNDVLAAVPVRATPQRGRQRNTDCGPWCRSSGRSSWQSAQRPV
jgi:hypothetical protein